MERHTRGRQKGAYLVVEQCGSAPGAPVHIYMGRWGGGRFAARPVNPACFECCNGTAACLQPRITSTSQ